MWGKDYDAWESYIGTRNRKNIKSHAQKFLARLLRFLEKNSRPDAAFESMTVQEAKYFSGVLSQRIHKSTKIKRKRMEKE